MKTAQIEVDLPMLINHCGKLRMLSHRFVMMLSLCQPGVPRKAEYFAAAQEALKGLKTTARYFVNPEAVRDNLDHAALYLKRGDVLDPEAIAILSRFIVESDRLMQTAERDVLTLDDLCGHAEQAAGPLLAHLNGLIDCINQEIGTLSQDRVAKSNSDAEVISNSIRELDRSTQMITIISLNASIEATRLGETGLAFKQIVNEIRDMSNHMTKIAVSLKERIEFD